VIDRGYAEAAYAILADFSHRGWSEVEDGRHLRLEVFFDEERDAQSCAERFEGAFVSKVEGRNWVAGWQADWKPVEAGRRFFLAPSWATELTPPGRIRLEMRPGLVFGGGDHATTQLCIELLEQAVRPGMRMADIGCGTAILAQAALALGAALAVGCDLDPSAVDTAAGSGVPVFEGSVDAIRSGAIDVLAANLPTGALITLLPELERVLRPGGEAVFSGYLVEQRGMLASEAAAAGFDLLDEISREEWAASRMVASR
jgi:ribosomal protein L11 methyltransferase